MIKKIIKHGGGYFLVSILTKATGFILLPFITRHLSLDEYGLYSNLQSLLNVLYLVATLGFDAAYARFIYDYNDSPKRLRILVSSMFFLFFCWALVYIPLAYFIVRYSIDFWGGGPSALCILLPIITLLQQLAVLSVSLQKSRHETKNVLTVSTVTFTISQTLTLIFLISYKMGAASFFWSALVANSCATYVYLKYLLKERLLSTRYFSLTLVNKIKGYAFGYIPASISSWVFTMSDRYIITYYISIAMAGKYAFITQIVMIIQIAMQSIDTAFSPIFMRLMNNDEKDRNKLIVDYFTIIFMIVLIFYIGLILFSPVLIEAFFPEKYRGDYDVLIILGMGVVFLSLRKLFVSILVYYKKSFWISASGYIPAIVNLCLNFVFVPQYGIHAAAYTTLISYILYALIVYLLSRKLTYLPLHYSKITSLLVIALFISILSLYKIDIIQNLFLFLIYLGISYLMIKDNFYRLLEQK